jgi:FkbM family methyltransferase
MPILETLLDPLADLPGLFRRRALRLIKGPLDTLLRPLGGQVWERNNAEDDIKTLLPPTATIFDVGAHIGESIASFRKICPSSQIHSFEPTPETWRMLEQRWGAEPGVKLNRMAVGDYSGAVTFYTGPLAQTNSVLPIDEYAEWYGLFKRTRFADKVNIPVEVDIITIDDYCAGASIDHIDLLKIDTQGNDDACVRGARRMLAESRIDMIHLELIFGDFYNKRNSFHDVEKLILPHGFRLANLYYPHIVNGRTMQLDALYIRESQ